MYAVCEMSSAVAIVRVGEVLSPPTFFAYEPVEVIDRATGQIKTDFDWSSREVNVNAGLDGSRLYVPTVCGFYPTLEEARQGVEELRAWWRRHSMQEAPTT
jgi:hypothetical protein